MADKLTPKQEAQQMMLDNMHSLFTRLVGGETDLPAGRAKKAARFVAKEHNKLLKRTGFDGVDLDENP